MCAVTMDYRGNFSDMWMSEPFMFNYNEQTKLPLEEIISKIFGSSTQSAKPAKLNLMK
jgi:hypothetical protein